MSETAETDATGEMSARARFDPSKYLRVLKGKGGEAEYLDVRYRLLWLRTEHPDAEIVTEHITITDELAIFKARVSIPGGGSATGYGSETAADFRDHIEKSECVPLDSDILTRRGFVSFNEASVGEDVLAYDPATDCCLWTPLREIKVYASGPVATLTNVSGVRLRCTEEHTWAIAGGKLRETIGLGNADRIVLAAPAPGGDSPITAAEAAMLGWLFTDGTIKRRGGYLRGAIMQSKPATVATIRDLVGAVAHETVGRPTTRTFPSGRTYECLPQHTFSIPAAVTRALFEKAGIVDDGDLPALATRLSVEARAAMLEAMMQADGDKRGRFAKKRRPGVMEAWRVLCTLQGVAVSPLRDHNGMPMQKAKKRRHLCVSELTIAPAGNMPVWCPTTDYGTWVMRQQGQVTITGNTKALGRALGALGYGTQFARDFDMETPEGAVAVVDTPLESARARASADVRPIRERGQGGQSQGGGNQLSPATDRQRNFIHVIAREAGLDDAELRNWSTELYGMGISELNRRDASALIESLQRRRNELA